MRVRVCERLFVVRLCVCVCTHAFHSGALFPTHLRETVAGARTKGAVNERVDRATLCVASFLCIHAPAEWARVTDPLFSLLAHSLASRIRNVRPRARDTLPWPRRNGGQMKRERESRAERVFCSRAS